MRKLGDQSEEGALDQIRINIAFEEMVVAVLTGAFTGGILTFLFAIAQSLDTGLSVSGLVAAFLQSFFVCILIFIIGFGASAAFGAPLFAALEQRKRRNVWPYLGAAVGVAVAACVVLTIAFPSAGGFSIKLLAVTIAPAVIVGVVFSRRMRPHWRAAEKAEAEAEAGAEGPIIVRIH